jgi:hypothetical protein
LDSNNKIWGCYIGSGKTSPNDGGTQIRGTKDVDLKLHNLGDESFLTYCKISSLISLFSLSFFSLVFFPLSHARSKGLNWSCEHKFPHTQGVALIGAL